MDPSKTSFYDQSDIFKRTFGHLFKDSQVRTQQNKLDELSLPLSNRFFLQKIQILWRLGKPVPESSSEPVPVKIDSSETILHQNLKEFYDSIPPTSIVRSSLISDLFRNIDSSCASEILNITDRAVNKARSASKYPLKYFRLELDCSILSGSFWSK